MEKLVTFEERGDENKYLSFQAFYLVQRIQEEVHRFAITFHRNVRSKNSFSSILDDIPGVGPKTRTKLMRHFKSLTILQKADIQEITDLGINRKTAENVKETLANYEVKKAKNHKKKNQMGE